MHFHLIASHFVVYVLGNTAPVFSPVVYSTYVGMSSSVGTTVVTVTYNDADPTAPDNTVTLSLESVDAAEYFEISGNDVNILRPIDVEYGETVISFKVLAIDGNASPLTGTATISLTTLQSSTTTTTTPPPPGYVIKGLASASIL